MKSSQLSHNKGIKIHWYRQPDFIDRNYTQADKSIETPSRQFKKVQASTCFGTVQVSL